MAEWSTSDLVCTNIDHDGLNDPRLEVYGTRVGGSTGIQAL